MAAGSYTVYSNAALNIGEAGQNLNSDAYYMILVTNSYTPAPNTDSTYANVSADEVATGNGYTVGGVKLTGQSASLSGATVTFTSSAVTWATFSATFRYMVLVHSASGTGIVSTDKLLCYCDATGGAGGSITGGGGTLTVTQNASGIFTITHSP